MNFMKTSINRAKQTVEEKLGDAKKTELDADLQQALNRMDDAKNHSQKIIFNIEAYLQPDPTQRMLEGLFKEGLNESESVGAEMGYLGSKLGSDDPYGCVMLKGSDAFTKLGKIDRERLKDAGSRYLGPMKSFLNEEMKHLDAARRELENKRLDMDVLKPKAEKGGNATAEADYKRAKEAYDGQVVKVREVLKCAEEKLPQLQDALKGLVTVELDHAEKTVQIFQELKNELN